jgi:hypothetical protein
MLTCGIAPERIRDNAPCRADVLELLPTRGAFEPGSRQDCILSNGFDSRWR